MTDDYLNSLGAEASSGQITPSRNEAPILFERKGFYYLMYGPLCCFCHQGWKVKGGHLTSYFIAFLISKYFIETRKNTRFTRKNGRSKHGRRILLIPTVIQGEYFQYFLFKMRLAQYLCTQIDLDKLTDIRIFIYRMIHREI